MKSISIADIEEYALLCKKTEELYQQTCEALHTLERSGIPEMRKALRSAAYFPVFHFTLDLRDYAAAMERRIELEEILKNTILSNLIQPYPS